MLYSKYKIKLKDKIWAFIKYYFYLNRIKDSNIILNINYDNDKNQKRILICYLAKGYFVNIQNNTGRTILHEIFKIIRVFSEIGYSIDLIDCNDSKLVPLIKEKKYDLIFGFGEAFYQMTELQPAATSILYMTENPPTFSYREEKNRLDYYYLRHTKHAKIQRSGKFYKLYHLHKKYSYVITFGETELLKDQYMVPYHLFPTGIINSKYGFHSKNHQTGRKNFLWLGSTGAIHKGLDLLIDIFQNREDITLHICGLTHKDKSLLGLPKRKNIVEYGHIDIKSDIFLKIIETCSYTILPSCSEGCATSILTGMLHGLIPIVMKDAGFNQLKDNAIFLDDFKLDYLNYKIDELSNDLPENLDSFSKKTFDFARENFTISVFESNFRKIINSILNQVD